MKLYYRFENNYYNNFINNDINDGDTIYLFTYTYTFLIYYTINGRFEGDEEVAEKRRKRKLEQLVCSRRPSEFN